MFLGNIVGNDKASPKVMISAASSQYQSNENDVYQACQVNEDCSKHQSNENDVYQACQVNEDCSPSPSLKTSMSIKSF